MRKVVLWIFLLPVMLLGQQGGLDSRFHTLDEIYNQLSDWQETYPQYIKLDTIGYSTNAHIPLIAAKISDNPAIREDEPRILLIGQHHAEEILGVEIVLSVMQELLENATQSQQFRAYIQNAELWFLPTINPEGLNVVMSGQDVTFRKNFTDNNHNNEFDFEPGIGMDIDGVDINRNYDFCWIHGDSLYEGDYDYYRGPDAFSESETRAVANLALEQHFLYSFSYHSARSGTPEIIYYPWNFGDGAKRLPDFDVIQNLANNVAGRILRQDGVNHYRTFAGTSRLGNAHNWMYAKANSIQLLVEVGTNNLQPDSTTIEQVISRNKEGVYYLFDRTIGYYQDKNLLTGHITDAVTGAPLKAQVTVLSKNAPYLERRQSEEATGRYWRPLLPGTYTVQVSRMGYHSKAERVIVGTDGATLDFAMQPRPKYQVSWLLQDRATGDTLNQDMSLCYVPNTEMISGSDDQSVKFSGRINQTALDSGMWRYVAKCFTDDGMYLTRIDTVQVKSDTTIKIGMPQATILVDEDFSSLSNWENSGHWSVYQQRNGEWAVKTQSGRFYGNITDETLTLAEPLDLTNMTAATMKLWSWRELEWEHDSASVEIQSIGSDSTWRRILEFSDQPDSGGTYSMENQDIHYADLTLWAGEEAYLRLHFWSDNSIADRGWHITQLQVTGTSEYLAVNDNPIIPEKFKMYQNYPNPFNASTVIEYQVPGTGKITLRIYNLLGQVVFSHTENVAAPGRNVFRWDGINLTGLPAPTGMYFARIRWANRTAEQKLLLLR